MLSIFFIGIALSMDAFSLSLSLGTLKIDKKKLLLLPLIVGIMHFIMPILGLLIGKEILNIININPKFILVIILLYLSILMYINRNKNEIINITSYINIFLFSFSVSLDSFSLGIGLLGITEHYILAAFIFSICSSVFTYLGILIGKYSTKFLKENASVAGAVILFLAAFVNICQIIF